MTLAHGSCILVARKERNLDESLSSTLPHKDVACRSRRPQRTPVAQRSFWRNTSAVMNLNCLWPLRLASITKTRMILRSRRHHRPIVSPPQFWLDCSRAKRGLIAWRTTSCYQGEETTIALIRQRGAGCLPHSDCRSYRNPAEKQKDLEGGYEPWHIEWQMS